MCSQKQILKKQLPQRDADKANMDMAKALFDQLLIRAPFAGRIGLNLVNVGDFVTAGMTWSPASD